MEHTYKRSVHFADTDAAGVVHFSRILCYAEEAEHDLLRSLGIPLLGDGGWPRVHVHCDYLLAVEYGETLDIVISPENIGGSSIAWSFFISREGVRVAQGSMKTVRVDKEGKPVDIGDAWRRALSTCS